ncbi:hypothetical protein Tco_0881208 [Tanacetum coccineum]
MAMSLRHRGQDTNCGGVIGPRCSLFGAYRCILGAGCYILYHERVMNPLDIPRKTIKDKGKRADPPSSSSSSSSDENEEPSCLEFYVKLSDNKNLRQNHKRGIFKCLNRYFDTITKYLKKQK